MGRLLNVLDGWLEPRRNASAEKADSVLYWQRRVLDMAMFVGLSLATISLVPASIRAVHEENYPLLAFNFLALAAAATILGMRSAPYRVRAGGVVVLPMAIGLAQLFTSGIHTVGPVWMYSSAVVAAILFGVRSASAVVAFLALVLGAQLVGKWAGLLPPGLAAEVGSPRWLETATDTLVLATTISVFTGVLLRGLRISFERLNRMSADLEEERGRLLRTNEELKQQVARRLEAEADRARLATAVEQAPDAVVIVSLEGTVLYVNAAFQRLFARTRVIGESFLTLGLFQDDETMAEVWATLGRDAVWSGRLTGRREKDLWPAQASFTPLRDGAGRPSHHVGMIRDVSREVELEAQLRQSQKMEAIGTFAGGIAHDFNNLLVPILGTAELLKSGAEPGEREQLDDIVTSARRGKDLVAQILAFSRGGEVQRGPLRLATILEKSDRMLRASLPATIELSYRVEDAGPVRLSDSEAQQILMNLCTNAFHAMRGAGGSLTIGLEGVRGGSPLVAGAVATAAPEPGRAYVRLSVTDSGEGMDDRTLGRAFEPFFTTKGSGEGTGLGLAMVHGVVQAVGGLVVARSEGPGRGTTVEVLLPRVDSRQQAPSASVSEVAGGRGERVLVVDDEEIVRKVTGRILEKLGYRPVLADGAETALRTLAAPEPLALLLTDLSMPAVDGVQLGRRARTLRPDLPMILCSGLIDADTVERGRTAGFDGLLSKPFDQAELAAAVAQALEPESGKVASS